VFLVEFNTEQTCLWLDFLRFQEISYLWSIT